MNPDLSAAISMISAGEIVAIVDDGRSRTEVDLVVSGATITTAKLSLMREIGSGQFYVPIDPDRLDMLDIPLMVNAKNPPLAQRASFTVTVDLIDQEAHPSSLHGLVGTIRALANFNLDADRFARPGHVAPLRARKGGVLRRIGHTEAAVDLARLAGLPGIAVISTLITKTGVVADRAQATELLAGTKTTMISISDILHHRRSTEQVVFRVAESELPTPYGSFKAVAFHDTTTDEDHVALQLGEVCTEPAPLVRVHSECLTGDAFGSLRCDCGEQLQHAMQRIAEEGRGIVLYMRQEGRGIGLANKLRAYQLQDKGLDTVEANRHLGFAVDLRDYGVGAQILHELGLRKIRLLTNNPKKTDGFETYGLQVVEQISLAVEPGDHNRRYLDTKRERLGHTI